MGKSLEELRNKYDNGNGMTQRQLADLLGVKPQTISSWENGRTKISEHYKQLIAGIFRIDKDEIDSVEKRTTRDLRSFQKNEVIKQLESYIVQYPDPGFELLKNVRDLLEAIVSFSVRLNSEHYDDLHTIYNASSVIKCMANYIESCKNYSTYPATGYKREIVDSDIDKIIASINSFLSGVLVSINSAPENDRTQNSDEGVDELCLFQDMVSHAIKYGLVGQNTSETP